MGAQRCSFRAVKSGWLRRGSRNKHFLLLYLPQLFWVGWLWQEGPAALSGLTSDQE